MNNTISISLFRVSGDSRSLDMVFDCPRDHYFHSLNLEVRYLEKGMFKSKYFDLSTALFYDDEGEIIKNKHHWVVRLPLYKLTDVKGPAIYKATFKAQDDEELDILVSKAYTSDVNFAYKCMLEDVLKEEKCENVSDDAIRKYLLLYGHVAALNTRDIETAEEYFKLIVNCFNRCSSEEVHSKVQSCNCCK